MSEKALSHRVCRAIRTLDPVRVENPAYPGTPDVNYIEGWIELKQLNSWPKRKGTVVTLRHFTKQQRAWLRKRCNMGGQAYLLLQVGQEYLLFWGTVAANIAGLVDQESLRQGAIQSWLGREMDKELVDCLLPQKS